MGWGGGGWGRTKSPPLPVAPVTYTNVGFGPQNFLTFSFNSFATLEENFKFVPSDSPKLLNLNEGPPSKKILQKRFLILSHKSDCLYQ